MSEKTGRAGQQADAAHAGVMPANPAQAGFVGKRRPVVAAFPDPNGNRAERRAAARRRKTGITR